MLKLVTRRRSIGRGTIPFTRRKASRDTLPAVVFNVLILRTEATRPIDATRQASLIRPSNIADTHRSGDCQKCTMPVDCYRNPAATAAASHNEPCKLPSTGPSPSRRGQHAPPPREGVDRPVLFHWHGDKEVKGPLAHNASHVLHRRPHRLPAPRERGNFGPRPVATVVLQIGRAAATAGDMRSL